MWWLIVIIVVCLYYYSRKRFQYFSSRGVHTLPPSPFLGNLTAVAFGKENFVEAVAAGYDKFTDQRYFGIYQLLTPTLVPRDPELIRNIMVRDFQSFHDRGVHVDVDCDPLFGRNLFMLSGSKWRCVRASLTPAFSSSRCRGMVPLMAEKAQAVTTHLQTKLKKHEVLDIEPITISYMNDVIASCAFGFAVDSLKDPNNCIFELGKKAILQDTTQVMKFIAYGSMKTIMKFLNIKMISTQDAEQFSYLFKSALKARREKQVKPRPDFIQILVDTANEMSDDDLVAQAVLFYIAGYDTTASIINFFLYEMAMNPDIQKRLHEELDQLPADEDVSDWYETVNGLKYLDMCVSEVLRLWPVAGVMDRRSTTTYDFGPTNQDSKERFIVSQDQAPAGFHVWIPIFSIHRDEKHWPNPNVYDPERFAPERKADIVPYTYIPFGIGPRHCIGSRFALLAAKMFLVKFLRMYRTRALRASPRLSPRAFILRPADGFMLIVEHRNED